MELDEEKVKDNAELEAERERRERELDELFEIIKMMTPGTKLREALDDIARAGLGALIVVGDSDDVLRITNGGIKINCKFTPPQLVELGKLDGALILSDDLKKIVYCNTVLVPDPSIESKETGTRHQAAERTAKQTSKPVIAISERRKTISLYYKSTKYTLRATDELLSKAIETLRMLEKHREILNELFTNLNVLEFTSLATLTEVVLCIQRIEIIKRITNTIQRYLTELGDEGSLVKILVKEVIKGIEKEEELVIQDYSRNWEFTNTALSVLSIEDLIEPENIIRTLLYSSSSDSVEVRGQRILAKTSLNQEVKGILTKNFKSLKEMIDFMETAPDELKKLIGEKETNKLIKELNTLKEHAMVGKKI